MLFITHQLPRELKVDEIVRLGKCNEATYDEEDYVQ
jgi:hypothetical protein